jgi:hypothetical protein
MSKDLRYEEVPPVARAEAEAILSDPGAEAARICETLVSLAYHEPDWRLVQDLCLRFLQRPDPAVRGCAAVCLGHLARIHRTIDASRVLPALRALKHDAAVSGRVDDALSDIRMFTGS